ncbi:unnamed protein product [Boreogadus saida]
MFRQSINKAVSGFGGLTEWPDFGMLLPVCLATNGKKPLATNGTLARCSLTVWTLVLLLLHCSLAAEVAKPSDSLGASRELEPAPPPADATGGAGANARAAAGTEEWKPGVAAGAVAPARPREPAAPSPQGHAPPSGRERGPGVRAAFTLPAGGLPLGLLSKAAWARSSSSMPSKTPKSKAASQPSSSSSAAAAAAAAARAASRENQTAATQTLPPVVAGSANLSSSNPSADAEEPMSSLPAWDLPTIPESLLSTLGDHDITLPDNITSPFSTHQWNTTAPGHPGKSSKQSPTSSTITSTSTSTSPTTSTSTSPTTSTSTSTSTSPTTSTSPSTSRMHLTLPLAVTTPAAPPPPSTGGTTLRAPLASPAAPGPRHTGAGGSRQSTSTRTAAAAAATTAAAVPERTTPALPTTTEPPPSSTSEEGALPCNITEKYWLKTVLSIQLRRNRLDLILKQNLAKGLSHACSGATTTPRLVLQVLSIQLRRNRLDLILKQNLAKGLSHALQRALNDTNASAQMEQDACSPYNVTLAYHVTSGKSVYVASLVVEALNAHGFDRLLSDMRQHAPSVKAVLVPVATWLAAPSVHLQLKTVLRFTGPTDNIYSCSFVQLLEQRLETAFDEAQDKVLETYSRLTVEIQSVSQVPASPSVAVVYVVRNQDALLNGTISSGLLNQLTAELVGYFLFYPPLLIAEPLEYHNLNTSAATKSYWVITVIQDVDTGSLESSYQSFASLMEQRLAELFLVAGRQGAQVARVRRASSVGAYTVQMVSIRRLAGPKDPAEMTYYAQLNGEPILGTAAAKTLSTLDSQTMALTLGYFVQVQAEPVVKTPPGNLWLLAVMTPVALLLVVLGMVAFILCKRNRVIFKTSAFRTFKTRSKTSYRREGSYHHQPVQGFDYAKKHIGRPGDETTSVTKETLLLALPARDAPLSLERKAYQDGTANRRPSSTDMHKGGRLPSEEGGGGGSMSSDGSGKLNTGKSSSSSTRRTLTAGSVVGSSVKTHGKEELHKRGNNGVISVC